MPTNGLVSHSWQFAGTKTNPQILRMSLKALKTDVADILNPATSGKITVVRNNFGKWTGADGIIGGKITRNMRSAGIKRWPDIFETEGIQIDLKFVDIEKRNRRY